MPAPGEGERDVDRPSGGRIAVIGVGNPLRRDDEVGWSVVRRVDARSKRAPLPEGAQLTCCDGDPERLISLWQDTDATILIDAASTGGRAQPGTVARCEPEAGSPWHTGAASSHGLGPATAFELGRILGRSPRRLIVFTVEGGDFSMGEGLTERVADAVECVARLVEKEIRSAISPDTFGRS